LRRGGGGGGGGVEGVDVFLLGVFGSQRGFLFKNMTLQNVFRRSGDGLNLMRCLKS
jgi:hypothetical protein